MNRRNFLRTSAAAAAATALGHRHTMAATPPELPEATAAKLPRWRGFNLLEKFRADSGKPFVEHDFQWISAWGFNFARLPMDYRCWAKTPDVTVFDEQTMRDIDQAIEWGKQYGIHINLNFHRGPGYCVNAPKEAADLWSDSAIQAQFARHWGVFAKRYAGVPARQLSFDLINEPPSIEGAIYAAAMKPAIDAIRAADPQRIIIADGVAWGNTPVQELVPFGIAQSTRGYAPMEISHYQATWIPGSDKFPVPAWPMPAGMNSYLFGPEKADIKTPLTLQVQCPRDAQFSIRVEHVSHEAGLVVKADGVVVLQHSFKPAPGDGEWKTSAANRWGSYDADYGRDYPATIPAGTREIQVSLEQGDWLSFSAINFNGIVIQPTDHDWGVKQEAFTVEAHGVEPVAKRFYASKETLWEQHIKPWQALAAKGVGVHVGEWGAHNHTPHEVALAWMRDCLANWRTAGFGWALWNLRGSFGIVDSDRKDVAYENFQGHLLDRGMLDLLRAS